MDNLGNIRPTGISRMLLWLYIFSFAFDFKGEEGGSSAHVAFLTISFFSGIGYLVLQRARRSGVDTSVGAATIVLTLLWAFIISSGITALIMVVPFDHYGRVLLPFLLCGLSAAVATHAIRARVDILYLGRVIFWAAAVSAAWTFVYALFVIGYKISDIRYQIVTPMAPYILAYGAWAFATKSRLSIIYKLVIIFTIGLIVVSITRTFIIVATLVYIAYLAHGQKKILGTTVANTGIIGITIMGALVIAVMLRPDVLETWNQRLFDQRIVTGTDLTVLTRLAEYSGQWESLTSEPLSTLIGRGLGSEYAWGSSYIYLLGSALGSANDAEIYGWYGGHSLWVYSLYSGGILFGWIIPGIFFMSLCQSFISIRRSSIHKGRLKLAATLPYFVLMGFLGVTFTSHPLMYRASAVALGFIFVWSSWLYSVSTWISTAGPSSPSWKHAGNTTRPSK